MALYKVTFKNGSFKYVRAESLDEARGKARADLRKQRGYEHSIGYGGPQKRTGARLASERVHAGIRSVKKEGT